MLLNPMSNNGTETKENHRYCCILQNLSHSERAQMFRLQIRESCIE